MKPHDYLNKHTDIDADKMQLEKPMMHYNVTKAMIGYARMIVVKELERLEHLNRVIQERAKQLKQE